MPQDVPCTNEEKVTATVAPTTTTGRPAQVDGSVRCEIAVDGGSTFTLLDDRSVDLISGDTPGDTTFVLSVDADLGEGVELVQDTVTLKVAGAKAANLGVSVGAPAPK